MNLFNETKKVLFNDFSKSFFSYGFFKWNDKSIDVGCMNIFDVVLPGPGFNVFQRNLKLNGGAWD